jgi:hypothetical protein
LEVGKVFQGDQIRQDVNPTFGVIDLWMKWTMLSGNRGLEYVVEGLKGKKARRRQNDI